MLIASTIEELAGTISGRLLRSGDPGYDEARAVWNGMIDRRPALIAQCVKAGDVISAVNFAREQDLPLAVKAGGHQVAGRAVCDDGLVIDLAPMNAVQVDPEAKTARVGAGARWADFDQEAQKFGLATTGGVDSRTGVAGLTLGGGIGYLARSYGLACDNLIGAEVVTAAGELVRASESEHSDLFWALRGGGGNFGVVTTFEFQLHQVGPEVLVAQSYQPFERAADTLRFYRDFMADAPDEVACLALVIHVPPVAPFPEEFHGQDAVALVACYSGPVEEGRAWLEPLENFGDPLLAFTQPMPYAVLQQSFDAGTPNGQRYYFKSQYLPAMPDAAIDTIVRYLEPLPGAFSMVGVEPMGGAINRVDPAATANPHRSAAFNFSVWAGWSDPAQDGEVINWAREYHEAIAPYSTGGVYVNYLDRDEEGRARKAFGANYERLQQVKARYDRDNLFRLNQNVEPAG